MTIQKREMSHLPKSRKRTQSLCFTLLTTFTDIVHEGLCNRRKFLTAAQAVEVGKINRQADTMHVMSRTSRTMPLTAVF
jgi:hypothetical protein